MWEPLHCWLCPFGGFGGELALGANITLKLGCKSRLEKVSPAVWVVAKATDPHRIDAEHRLWSIRQTTSHLTHHFRVLKIFSTRKWWVRWPVVLPGWLSCCLTNTDFEVSVKRQAMSPTISGYCGDKTCRVDKTYRQCLSHPGDKTCRGYKTCRCRKPVLWVCEVHHLVDINVTECIVYMFRAMTI